MNDVLVRRFQALYNELDLYMREHLHRPPGVQHSVLIEQMAARDGYFRERCSRLQSFARLRNALVHNPDVGRFDPIAEPHPGVVAEYEDVIKYVTDPPRALSRAVRRPDLFTVTWQTPVVETLQTMRAKAYSLAPVVEDEHVAAVFLDCTLIRAFLESDGFSRDRPHVMNDLRLFVDHRGDQLGSIEYLPASATIRDVEGLFVSAFAGTTALRGVFLTADGTERGEVVGLITGYDLLK